MQMNSRRIVANTLQAQEVEAMMESNACHGVGNCVVTNIEPSFLAKVLQHTDPSSEPLLVTHGKQWSLVVSIIFISNMIPEMRS